jgi:hypothetical protein
MDAKQPAADAASAYVAEQLAAGKACFEAALDYLARGWCPIVVCSPDHVGVGRGHGARCKSPGKAPLVNWLAYQDRRPTRQEVEGWWRRWPVANVGILLGPASNLLAIDVDGVGGEARLRELSGGDVPATLEFATPRPGRRLLYRIPPGVTGLYRSASFRADDGELKLMGRGAMTVMPPSRHKNGGFYAWRAAHGAD